MDFGSRSAKAHLGLRLRRALRALLFLGLRHVLACRLRALPQLSELVVLLVRRGQFLVFVDLLAQRFDLDVHRLLGSYMLLSRALLHVLVRCRPSLLL